ncbi:DEAD/DEAH box helicase, partial [uncultured Rothia sp.]|uniref:ATP-dependent DNA helicase RecG n=1 Tax=uncultured Rothia sp. TaxID=316088 RepID=UPI0025DD0612
MSPRRTPKHSPEQEALDLGLFGAEPVAPAEPADPVVPAEKAESAALAEPHKRERGVPLLSDEQLRTTAELTVRDLAAFARGEASREELSERAARRTSAPYRKALRALKHSLGPAAHAMTDDALYELVDIALAARQTAQPETTQPEEPTPKKPARKAPARKKPAQKELAQKASAKKAPAERKAPAEKSTSASVAAEAKSRALARYAAEDSLENTPLKKYLPAPSAKAIATHLGITTVGQMLEYFPRKYLPRGELSSFAELVEGQDVTIIARVVHVSTRTMAARRGKITEVTITDRLADSSAHEESGFGGIGTVSVTPGRANASAPGTSSRGASGLGLRWQATGQYNPRIDSLAAPASYTGYADSYGQDDFTQNHPEQGGLFGVPAPAPLIGAQMKLSFFNAWTAAREIREGETMMFSGKVGIYRGEYTLTNPHYALLSKDASGSEMNEAATAPVPVYRAPAKLPTDRIAGYMEQLLEKVPLKELEDPVPYAIRRARKVPSLAWTYRALHTPDTEDTWRAAQAQMRYREAFVLQSALARLHSARAAHRTQARPPIKDGLADRLLEVLPYELTEGQRKVGEEISADLASESPMNRLLQGDVGSGKTVVALRAMLQVADAGGQSAMLAPTEVLAEQHLRSVLDILGDMAALEDPDGSAGGIPEGTVRVRLLTASMGTRAKRQVLKELADGTAQIVIGTHALLSDDVRFNDLGLVVVDEQHRFGVEQRDGLRGPDGALPHRLVMTATPIPRTVAMTVFGDLDVSVLDTLPAGRQKISTHVVPLAEKPAWASRLWQRAREEIDAGHQVYVVVPKIGEDGDGLEEGAAFFGASSLNGAGTGAGNSAQGYFGQDGSASSDGKVQLTSVASMHAYLSAEDSLVGVRIGTLHGRMDPAEKTAVMTAFERGEIDLLISTTVIEVGVNVPNATLMIIMDADRFGISGLHQLR